MGERSEHAPGTFSWADLATTDIQGAKAFYSEVFGWAAEDMPAGEGMTYTMFRVNGDDVAAGFEQGEQERSQEVPPHWNCYVTVADLEATAGGAAELGGTVMMEPFDVLDAGRMAVVQDPTGGILALWLPKRSIGARRVNDEGCMSWNELRTRDLEAAKAFYAELLGWTYDEIRDGGDVVYTTVRNDERMNGGMIAIRDEWGDVPPHWAAYFTVADCDATASKTRELGGDVSAEPFDVPAGRFAVLADPQGASFSVFEGETQP